MGVGMKKGLKVISLFDGIACGYEALKRAGIPVAEYHAFEIDKYAIQIAKKNHPDIQHWGSVEKVNFKIFEGADLVIGGSPCQGLSFAGKQLAFDDPRSKLFFEFVRALKEIKPKYFLLENVMMKKEYLDAITELIGVEPIMIDSALVSAQRRKRYYWTNIPNVTQPEDKGIYLKDIIHENEQSDYAQSEGWCKWWREKGRFQLNKKYSSLSAEKAITMTARQYSSWNGNFVFEPIRHEDSTKPRIFKNLKDGESKASCLTATCYKGSQSNGMTNIFGDLQKYIVPFDKTLQILDKEVEKGKIGYFGTDSQSRRVYYVHDKAVTLCGSAGGGAAKMGQYAFNYGVKKMFGYIYMSENSINGKKYIGKHKSKKFNPDYIGSGKAILDSLHKYNKNDYSVIMLEACSTESELNDAEFRLIKEHNAVSDKGFYNLKDGGDNGFLGGSHSKETKEVMSKNNSGRCNPFYGKTHSEETKKRIGKMEMGVNNHNYGGLTEEHSKKIGDALRGVPKTKEHKEALKGKRAAKICPYCGLPGAGGNMTRYHFDNCKQRQQYLFGCITPDRVEKRQNGQRFSDGRKFYTLTAQDKHGVLVEGYIRKLTPVECERLQTLPDSYTEVIDIKNYELYNNEDVNNNGEVIEWGNVALKSVSEKQKPINMVSFVLCTTKSLFATELQNCQNRQAIERRHVSIAVEKLGKKAAGQEACVIDITKIGLDIMTLYTLIKSGLPLEAQDTRSELTVKMSTGLYMKITLGANCTDMKKFIMLVVIKLITELKIYIYVSHKANIQFCIENLNELRGSLLSVELLGLKMGTTQSLVSDSQRYKALGNGWTVDVIAHIFKGLTNDTN